MTARHATTVLISAVGLALAPSPAWAQVNWTTQMGFALTPTGPTLPGNQFNLTATGTYTFYVRVGIFNPTGLIVGQANYGLNNWTANVNATGLQPGETLGLSQSNARIAPFTFGPATSFGGTLTSPSTITGVNAARDVSGGASAPWLWDITAGAPAPQPTLPAQAALGANSLTNVWRFTITITTLVSPNYVITFAGQAGPVIQWAVFGATPPDDTTTGSVNFLGITPNPVLRDYPPTTLIVSRVPAPGSSTACLAAALLYGTRRRRQPTPGQPAG